MHSTKCFGRYVIFFFQAEDGIRDLVRSRGLGDVYKRQLSTMTETYGAPNGGLCIVLRNNIAVGVAGIKRFSETECEVKRMYVQPESRGLGIGKLLLTHCIEIAKSLNYDTVKLDTADFMKSAIKLYIDSGFIEIPAYRHNPYEAVS